MRQDLKILEQIDRYLEGQMTVDELATFEQQINQNKDLKTQVENQKLIIQAVKRQVLSNQINAVAKGGFFNYKWGIGLGIILLIIGGLIVSQLDYKSNNETIKTEHKIETKTEIVTTQPIQKKEIVQVDSVQKNETVVESLTQPKSTLKPKNERKIEVQNKNELYDFKGLQCWVKPDVQIFEINTDSTETIEGREGTLIIIPKHSFLDENGNTVNGKVNFELVEAYTLDDILLYNLTTTANGNLLETGGMFYTNATQNGNTLKVNPDKPMMIQIPCVKEKPNMMAFESEIDTAGNINWKNPKPLEQFLTKVDMNLLDFLPSEFENEVYASMPILGFEKANSIVVDSLYYLMSSVSENLIGEFWIKKLNEVRKKYSSNRYRIVKNGDIILVYEKEIECGINPLSIKTIKENPDYANSFIATKEFEERIKELHKLENGQAMLDVYLNNLDKNLWYSDSIVARKIKLSAPKQGQKSNIFDDFYAERKTKVRDGDLYAKALSTYYSFKKQEYKDELEKIRNKNNRQLKNEIKKLENIKKSNNKTLAYQNKLANINVSRGKNYTVQWSSFGWANIDSYLHLLDKGSKDIEVSCEKSKHNGQLKIYQWLGAISTLTPIIVNKLKGIVKVPKKGNEGALKMKNTYTMAIAHQDDKWYFGSKNYNPYQTNLVEVNLTETTLNKLKQMLRKFGGTTPLIKQIDKDVKRLNDLKKAKEKQLEFERKKLEKQQKEDAFILRLKKLCFLCSGDDVGITNNFVTSESENPPQFPGGDDAMRQYINSNFSIPKECDGLNLKGTIYVEFIVGTKGEIKNVKIVKSLHPCLDTEAIRVVKSMPNWEPATQNGKPVEMSYDFPIKVVNQ